LAVDLICQHSLAVDLICQHSLAVDSIGLHSLALGSIDLHSLAVRSIIRGSFMVDSIMLDLMASVGRGCFRLRYFIRDMLADMSTATMLGLALGIGVMAGLRSMTAPAVVCWAAHLHWIDLQGSRLSFLGSTVAMAIVTLLAVGELVADKLPSTPNRTSTGPLVWRVLTGAL